MSATSARKRLLRDFQKIEADPPEVMFGTPSESSERDIQTEPGPVSVQSLLSDPNPTSPVNDLATQLYRQNRREYMKRVRKMVEESWGESLSCMI